jgi:hypothetical protein
MPVFKGLERVPSLKFNLSVEVFLVESLHWDFVLPAVLDPVAILVKIKVVLDRATRVFHFRILARGGRRCDGPEDHQDGYGSEGADDDGHVKSSTKGKIQRNYCKQEAQE